MRRLLLVVLAAAVGATLYATTAPAGHQTPRSRAEFNAVKARLAKVERERRVVRAARTAPLAGHSRERMMGLEPTTVCMAKAGARSRLFGLR
jgi:type II secretory pathway component PulM